MRSPPSVQPYGRLDPMPTIVAETNIAMAYSPKVAAVLGSARFLPKASVSSNSLTSGLFRSPRIIGYGPREVSVHLPGCRVPVPRPLCIHIGKVHRRMKIVLRQDVP